MEVENNAADEIDAPGSCTEDDVESDFDSSKSSESCLKDQDTDYGQIGNLEDSADLLGNDFDEMATEESATGEDNDLAGGLSITRPRRTAIRNPNYLDDYEGDALSGDEAENEDISPVYQDGRDDL